MNLFLIVAAALVRRDARELLGLKAQVAQAIADTSGHSSRKELVDLKNEINEALDDLATEEAWSLIRDARRALSGNLARASFLIMKLGPSGPGHLLRAVLRSSSLRRALEALECQLSQNGGGPRPPAPRAAAIPPRPRQRSLALAGGLGQAA